MFADYKTVYDDQESWDAVSFDHVKINHFCTDPVPVESHQPLENQTIEQGRCGSGIGLFCNGLDPYCWPFVVMKSTFNLKSSDNWLLALETIPAEISNELNYDDHGSSWTDAEQWHTLLPMMQQKLGFANDGDMQIMHKLIRNWHQHNDEEEENLNVPVKQFIAIIRIVKHMSSHRPSFDTSVFFWVHQKTSYQQLLHSCTMECIVVEGTPENEGALVMQLPIPDILPDKMQKPIDRCQSSWIHLSPLVRDPQLIPHFLHWTHLKKLKQQNFTTCWKMGTEKRSAKCKKNF